MRTYNKQQQLTAGFTLIELLVVISIIALLVGILLPVLSNARNAAKLTSCSIRQRQIATAAISYATDAKGHFPPSVAQRVDNTQYTNPNNISYGSSGNDVYLSDSFKFYLESGVFFHCPVGPGNDIGAVENRLRAGYELKTDTSVVSSFALLWNYSQWDEKQVPGSSAFGSFVAPRTLGDVDSDQLLVQDFVQQTQGVRYYITHPDRKQGVTTYAAGAFYGLEPGTLVPNDDMIVNAAYMDGHVESTDFSSLTVNELPWITIVKIFLAEKN